MTLHASQAGFYIQPAILNINNYFIKSQSTIRMNDHIGCIRYCTSKLLGLTRYKYIKTGVHASVLAPPSHQHSKQHVCSGNQQLLWNKSNAQYSPSNGSWTKKIQLHSRLEETTKSCSVSQTDCDGFPKCIHQLRIRTTAWRNSFRLIGIGFCQHLVFIPVTPSKVPIPYATHPYEVMQGTTCNNDLTLYMGGITRDFFHHPPLHFQHSKWPFYDIPKWRMCIIEDLSFTLWFWCLSVLL